MISIVPDFTGAPYGIPSLYPSWAGADKAVHLPMHPGMVQDRGLLLASLAINAWDRPDGYRTSSDGVLGSFHLIATNILLPRAVSGLWVAFPNQTSRPLVLGHETNRSRVIPLPFGTALGMRVGEVAMAAKVFHADGAGGQAPTLALRTEPAGDRLNAMRLTCEHFGPFASPRNVSERHIRYAALFLADVASDDVALAALTRRVRDAEAISSTADSSLPGVRAESRHGTEASIEGWRATDSGDIAVWRGGSQSDTHESASAAPTSKEWRVQVRDGSGTSLLVRHNLTCAEAGTLAPGKTPWNCLLQRAINGSDVVPTTLTVNGDAVPPPH